VTSSKATWLPNLFVSPCSRKMGSSDKTEPFPFASSADASCPVGPFER
jgi:hypothetical protein